MSLIYCQNCNKLVSDYLEVCPRCRQPAALEASRSWHFCEQWLLLGKVLLGMSLLGLFITVVVESVVLADFFARVSLLMIGLVVVGKAWQWMLFKRRR